MSLCPVAHKRKRKSAPTARISNDVGRCQDTPSPFRPPEPALNSKESAEAAVARSSRSALSTLHARSVSLHHDGVTHQTSLRSPADHDDACELPPSEGGGSPNQCCGHSRTTTRADTGIPARTPPLRLPRQPTTAELCVVNLIAQHDPESNAQFSRRRDARLGESLLRDLSTIEALQVWIPSRGVRRSHTRETVRTDSLVCSAPRVAAVCHSSTREGSCRHSSRVPSRRETGRDRRRRRRSPTP